MLFVSADILVIYLWQLRRKIRGKPAAPEDAP